MQLRNQTLRAFALALIPLLSLSACGVGASRQAQQPSPATVRITIPTEGERVPQEIRPEGTLASPLSAGEDLWVMVMDHRYFNYLPQDGPADEFDSRWQSPVANIGGKSSTGGKWDVVVFVVNQPAQKWFKNRLRDGRLKGVQVSELPRGASEAARVTVIR